MAQLLLWGNSRPRISYAQLSLAKQKEGIGLPELRNYYSACHLSRIIDWNVHNKRKDWGELEASFMSLSLSSLPWLFLHHIPTEISLHVLIRTTLCCFSGRTADKGVPLALPYRARPHQLKRGGRAADKHI